MIARYTDGTEVKEGDRVRYHQTPGGLLSPETNPDGSIKWHVGTAVRFPHANYMSAESVQQWREQYRRGERYSDPDELVCQYDVPSGLRGRYGHMAPHIIERLGEE